MYIQLCLKGSLHTFTDGLGGSCASNCRVVDGLQTASACYLAIKLASGCATHFSYSSSQARCTAKTVGTAKQLLMQISYGYTSGSIECEAANVTFRIHGAGNGELNEISGFAHELPE